jgi:hypothetical protein
MITSGRLHWPAPREGFRVMPPPSARLTIWTWLAGGIAFAAFAVTLLRFA